ncbi:hypothetical protein [Corynebacterium casei]|uniref:hypothetical protein n=1 Tax=Actinomycetes TaxID=1760 RepID=UPI003F955A73
MESSDRDLRRWNHLTSRKRLRRELAFMQRIIDGERAQKEQVLQDYDMVEAELKALLEQRGGDDHAA